MSQNNSTITYAGVDVAKDSLALRWLGRDHACSNDAKAHAQIVRQLQAADHPHVVLEASGGYERGLVRALHAAAIPVSVVEPGRVRAFARAKGRRAKTDPIDAAVLQAFGETLAPAATAPETPEQQELADLALRRRQLVEFATAEKNRSAHYEDALRRRQAKALLGMLDRQITQCADAIKTLLDADPELTRKAARLQEVPGVGLVTAATLLADMPELGTLTDTAAAALAGVAPFNRDSGPSAGTRRISGGRRTVRCALYMAALSAVRYDPILHRFHQHLLLKGKKPLVALTAVMRKLIVLLNRLLKNPKFVLQAKPNSSPRTVPTADLPTAEPVAA
jgi:transposase